MWDQRVLPRGLRHLPVFSEHEGLLPASESGGDSAVVPGGQEAACFPALGVVLGDSVVVSRHPERWVSRQVTVCLQSRGRPADNER